MTKRSRETVLDDLPEWIVIEEILVRLPPIDVLRCRGVRKSWRSGTSTINFMLDNNRRQRSLPVIEHPAIPEEAEGSFVVFRDADAGASKQNFWPILRSCKVRAVCDGLVIVSHGSDFYICNPVTRKYKYATLPQPRGRSPQGYDKTHIAGFYRHQPSGECRVLGFSADQTSADCYVFTLGFDNPRCIEQPSVSSTLLKYRLALFVCGFLDSYYNPQLQHRGSLHWFIGIGRFQTDMDILVFDTVIEKFRWMRSPNSVRHSKWSLFEMDGMLASCRRSNVSIEVWVMQDYETEAWTFKYRIDLLAMRASPRVVLNTKATLEMSVINERELLIWLDPGRLLHCDIDGKFLGYVESKDGNHRFSISRQYF